MAKPIIETYNLGKKYNIFSPSKKKRKFHLDSVLPFRDKKEVWALRNLDLKVEEGDIMAVMGSNGSGKSTLFRLLSEITDASEGDIMLRGKVTSMIEVGVGFHVELTGRENIYFNGAVLGMSRKETERQFDEIVAFSGVEQYLDVPIKKYSNGMYVKLAFAVASHLRTDILLVDEVLSVSDHAFRQKSISKLKQLAHEGRTIMIVSHDTQVLRSLCKSALHLENGRMVDLGGFESVFSKFNTNKAGEEVL